MFWNLIQGIASILALIALWVLGMGLSSVLEKIPGINARQADWWFDVFFAAWTFTVTGLFVMFALSEWGQPVRMIAPLAVVVGVSLGLYVPLRSSLEGSPGCPHSLIATACPATASLYFCLSVLLTAGLKGITLSI